MKLSSYCTAARLFGTLGVAFAAISANAQTCSPNSPTVGRPWVGQPGITETVGEIMARELLNATPWQGEIIEMPERDVMPTMKRPLPGAPKVSSWPPPAIGSGTQPNQTGGHHGGGPYSPQPIGANFFGIQISDTPGFIPPDTVGDVGPTQIVVCVNGRIKSFTKAGAPDGALNATTDTFFTSVRNGSGTSDPMVRYDRTSGRWFVSIINVATPNRVMLAVSSGSTIASSASFTFFQFQHDLVGTTPNSDTGGFADYTSMGVDANAVYIGDNVFNAAGTAFLGTSGFVIRKSSVTSGGPIVVTAFRQMSTPSVGPYAPRGVDQDDPAATEGYFIGVDSGVFSRLVIRRILTPGGTPTISGNLNLTVPTTVFPQASPSLGGAPLDALDDRLFQAHMRKNRISGATTLWTAHNIEVDAAGNANTAGNRNGSRWYEIQNMTTTPALRQSGTVWDPAGASIKNYWMPSVAMSGQGHMALGCSFAGTADRAGCATAGRYSGDTLGTIQAPSVVQAGLAAYAPQGTGGTNRWGDYSNMTVDPKDDQTIWGFQEYCNANNSWAIRVFSLIAPPPATFATLTPNSLAQGATSNLALVGTTAASSGWFDTEAGMNRLVAAFSGGDITVNSVTFVDPTHVTLNVTVGGAAAAGARNLTMTNPDGQNSTAIGVFTVTASAANVQPTTLTVSPGNIVAGGLADVLAAEDSRLEVTPGPVLITSQPPVVAVLEGTAPFTTASAMSINFEGFATASNINMITYAYNFTTLGYDQVDARILGISDTPFTVVVPNPADHMDGTGLMRLKMTCKATGPVLVYPWRWKADLIGWTVSP